MSERNLYQISQNAVQDIRKLYNLNEPGRMDEAIDILRKWIEQENHIMRKEFKREYLERTLIQSKGSVEKTKMRIDALCTLRTLTPLFFTINTTKSELREVLKIIDIVPLPILTKNYHRIVIIKINNAVFSHNQMYLFMQYCVLLSEYMSNHDYCKGYIFVNDLRGLNLFGFVTRINKVHFQQFMSIATKGYGTKIKAILIVSESKAVDLLTNLIRQFLSPKIAGRVSVYNNFDELLDKVLPREFFPEEYGGKQRSLSILSDEWVDLLLLEENMEHFKLMSTARTDETLRSPDKFNTDYLGMPGSIRKLRLD